MNVKLQEIHLIAEAIKAEYALINRLCSQMETIQKLARELLAPRIESNKVIVEVVHSQSKTAWNIVNRSLGGKYKIARIPYLVVDGNEVLTTRNKSEALRHAEFIAKSINSDINFF